MAIQLESTAIGGSGDGIPPLLLENVGAKYRGLIVNIEPKQEMEYLKPAQRDAGQIPRPVWWENRKPTPLLAEVGEARGLDKVMYDIITLSTVKAAGDVFVGGDEERAPEDGEVVKLFGHGPRGRGWRDALKERGKKPAVGDLVLISYDNEDTESDRKDISFTFEEPTAAQVAEAERLYTEIQSGKRTALPSSAAPMSDDAVADAFGADIEAF